MHDEKCSGGVKGDACAREASTEFNGIPLCGPHAAGRKAIRRGGAFNANGRTRTLYLLRLENSWKVGLATDVSQRLRDARRTHGNAVALVATAELPPTHLGFDGPIGHCIEHAVRLQFAMLSVTGLMINHPGPEWVTADPEQEDAFAIETFRVAIEWVLMQVEDNMLIRQGKPERWIIRAGAHEGASSNDD